MSTESELLEAWRAAEETWHADPLNREKERALDRAADALRLWRRVNTPEGRAYADVPKTFKDDDPDA